MIGVSRKKHSNSGVSEENVVDYVHESDMTLIASLQGDISCVKQDLSRRSHSSVPQRVSHFTNNQYWLFHTKRFYNSYPMIALSSFIKHSYKVACSLRIDFVPLHQDY